MLHHPILSGWKDLILQLLGVLLAHRPSLSVPLLIAFAQVNLFTQFHILLLGKLIPKTCFQGSIKVCLSPPNLGQLLSANQLRVLY